MPRLLVVLSLTVAASLNRTKNVRLDAARRGFSQIANARDVSMRDVSLGTAEPTAWVQPIEETWHRKA